jgi:membrane protease subunit (stomatin/prohibitin family)
MRRRRRPLLRAAMVGGAGYLAGRRMAERDEREAYQNEQLAELQEAQAAAPPAAVSAPSGTDRIEALTKLKELLDAGVLSESEFAAEKARILQGG